MQRDVIPHGCTSRFHRERMYVARNPMSFPHVEVRDRPPWLSLVRRDVGIESAQWQGNLIRDAREPRVELASLER